MQKTFRNRYKKYESVVMFMLLALLSVSCATQQQRAEATAKTQRAVAELVAQKKWRIDVSSMSTLRYGSRTVASDFFLELRGDTLYSYLPYMGQAFQGPLASPSQGLNFEKPIRRYSQSTPKPYVSRIEMTVKTQEDLYDYQVDIYDTGTAYIHVRSQYRDPISFDGCVVLP